MYESEPLKIHDVEPVPLIIAQLLNTHIVISSSACLCVSPVYSRSLCVITTLHLLLQLSLVYVSCALINISIKLLPITLHWVTPFSDQWNVDNWGRGLGWPSLCMCWIIVTVMGLASILFLNKSQDVTFLPLLCIHTDNQAQSSTGPVELCGQCLWNWVSVCSLYIYMLSLYIWSLWHNPTFC